MSAVLAFPNPEQRMAKPKSIEAELRDLLRREAALSAKLANVRAEIGPAKRAYAEKYKCFGLSNEALSRELGLRK